MAAPVPPRIVVRADGRLLANRWLDPKSELPDTVPAPDEALLWSFKAGECFIYLEHAIAPPPRGSPPTSYLILHARFNGDRIGIKSAAHLSQPLAPALVKSPAKARRRHIAATNFEGDSQIDPRYPDTCRCPASPRRPAIELQKLPKIRYELIWGLPISEEGSVPWERVGHVVTGAQVGVDELALRVAKELGIKTSGHAPPCFERDRPYLAERYNVSYLNNTLVRQSVENQLVYRAKRCAELAGATLALVLSEPSRGTRCTINYCRGGWGLAEPRHDRLAGRPVFEVSGAQLTDTGVLAAARAWLAHHRVFMLNVAGSRELERFGPAAEEFLRQLLAPRASWGAAEE